MKSDGVWGWLWAQTLRGLILLVPVVVTVSFLVWLSRTVDELLKPIVLLALPPEWYVPGLALLVFLAAALLLGMLTRNVLMRKVGETAEQWVVKTPVIGSIYPIVRQLTDLLSGKDVQQKNGKVVLVTGSPGSRTIINTVLCVVVNVIDFDMDIRSAVDAPRLHQQWMPDEVRFEGMAQHMEAVEGLKAMGHTLLGTRQGDAYSIWVDPKTGTPRGAEDRRINGKVAAY